MRNTLLWIVFLAGVACLAAYRFTSLFGDYIEWVQWQLAYPCAVVTTAGFMALLGLYLCRQRIDWREGLRPIAVLIPLFILVHLLEPHFLKVAMDEQAHLGVAYGMHEEGRCEMPMAAHLNYHGRPAIDAYGTTFRGYYLSVLVSLVSRGIGFSETVVYWVNAAAGGVVLVLVYVMSLRLLGRSYVAVVPPVFLLGTTIFGQVMCSGSYDMVNLALLAVYLHFLSEYVVSRDDGHARLLLACSVLLGYCRTESIVYYAGAVAVILVIRRFRIRADVLVTLPLVLPMLATQLVLTSSDRNLTQGQMKPGQELWSLANLVENWQDSIVYFLNAAPAKMGSLLLFLAGFGGLIVTAVRAARGGFVWTRRESVLAAAGAVAAGLYSVVMGSFWGGPSAMLMMTRFTLPLWLILALWSGYALKLLLEVPWLSRRRLLGGAVGWFIVFAMPCYASRDVVLSFDAALADKKLVEMAKGVDDGRTLFVYESCPSFVSRGLPCVEYGFFASHVNRYAELAKLGVWSRVIFVEKLAVRSPDGNRVNYNRFWSATRGDFITRDVAVFRPDAGRCWVLSEWTGLKTKNGVVDVLKREGEYPPHANQNELMLKLRLMMPREYTAPEVPKP